MSKISTLSIRKRSTAAVGVAGITALAICIGGPGASAGSTVAKSQGLPAAPRAMAAGSSEGHDEASEAAMQRQEARLAPGIVSPGAYSAAIASMRALPAVQGNWVEKTRIKYNADDERYRDFVSNSGGGAGYVTGRVDGLAISGKTVYAAAANGGVWRSLTGGGHWTPIADRLGVLSSGDLKLARNGWLWYASGDASTGADSYLGSGVFALSGPARHSFSPGDRVGGIELAGTMINSLRFSTDGYAYATTSRGLWRHSASTKAGKWKRLFAQNPTFLPGGTDASDPNAPYKNITTDIAIDPAHPRHMVLAAAWRGGDAANGFYETKNGGSTWTLMTGNNGIALDDIGLTSFAYSRDGHKLYAVVQSINNYFNNPDTALMGVYVSPNGNPAGPWTLIADSPKLAASGSALADSPGYGPGVQSWYNQFVGVDPSNPKHLYVGLEEVYESKDGGTTWTTVGPYWNFGFSCWDPFVHNTAKTVANCPRTTHPDQHTVAFGLSRNGTPSAFFGNDGGVYTRPIRGTTNALGHATDWTSVNDGTMDALQYYSVSVGKDTKHRGVDISGGLQDNGGSILRPGDREMGSNFGGDGGDSLVDPNNGCNIVQEYVNLAMSVTQNCASPPAPVLDPKDATTYDIAPPDVAARFIAPFAADDHNINKWIAGGNTIWSQDKGFAIRSGKEWSADYNLGASATGVPHVATAVAASNGYAYAGWCGTCNNLGFERGLAVGKLGVPSSWHQIDLSAAGIPNRYIGGITVDPKNGKHAFIGVGGFSRRWTEGPGAGYGHIFETWDAGSHWRDVSRNIPDVPVNGMKMLKDGSLVVGTDLGVVIRPAHQSKWFRLGTNLPTTTVSDLEVGPDGWLYAATYGRGIWAVRRS